MSGVPSSSAAGGAPRTAAALGSSTLLPAITASLRGEFVPLLQTLEAVNSYTSATYTIEVVFALVRFDAFLQRDERHLFVRAFNSLMANLLRQRAHVEETRKHLEECRDFLSTLVERCAMLEEMSEAKAREEYIRRKNTSSANVSANPTFAMACPVQLPTRAHPSGPAPGDTTAPPSMQDSFATTMVPNTATRNTTPTAGNLSFSLNATASNASMTDKQVVLQQAFRSSLRRRVERGLARGAWTAPAALSDLSPVPSSDSIARDNTSFVPLLTSDGAGRVSGNSIAAAPAAPTAAGGGGGAVSDSNEVYSSVVARHRRRLSGSSLPPLLPAEVTSPSTFYSVSGAGTATQAAMPPRAPASQSPQASAIGATRRGNPSPLPYYPYSPLVPLSSRPGVGYGGGYDGAPQPPMDSPSYSIVASPTTPMAATVEGLWEASFWSLLNGAGAIADVELLYGLLNATKKLTFPSPSTAAGGGGGNSSNTNRKHHHSNNTEHKHRGGGPSASLMNASNLSMTYASNTSRHLQQLQPSLDDVPLSASRRPESGAARRAVPLPPTPATATAVVNAVSSGTAEPAQWHTWFTILAVLSVLTEGFLFGGITAEEEQEKAAALGPHHEHHRPMRDGEDDGAEDRDNVPATPAVSLCSDVSQAPDDGDGDGGLGPSRSPSQLREPSPQALALLKRVYCPCLRNFKIGFDNVTVAAPVLAARAATGTSAALPQMPPTPRGMTHASSANGSIAAPGGGGVEASCEPAVQSQPQLRRIGPARSAADLTGSNLEVLSESFSPLAVNALNGNGPTSPDSFAFPVEPGLLSEGSETAIRPVDVVLHALITALEVQLEVAAGATAAVPCVDENANLDPVAASDDPATELDGGSSMATSADGLAGGRTPHPLQPPAKLLHPTRRSRHVSPTTTSANTSAARFTVPANLSFTSVRSGSGLAGGTGNASSANALITTLLHMSFSSAAAAQCSPGTAAAAVAAAAAAATSAQHGVCAGDEGSDTGEEADRGAVASAAEACGEGGQPLLSLPAIMRAELAVILENVSASLDTVASMAEQLKTEATLLIFRVVSTVLDWLIPAVYLVNHRVWLFYRAWICDLYALLQKEGLMEGFTSILDQDGGETGDPHDHSRKPGAAATDAGADHHRRTEEAEKQGHYSVSDTDSTPPPPEPPSTPTEAAAALGHREGLPQQQQQQPQRRTGHSATTVNALHVHAQRKRRGGSSAHSASRKRDHASGKPPGSGAKGGHKHTSAASTSSRGKPTAVPSASPLGVDMLAASADGSGSTTATTGDDAVDELDMTTQSAMTDLSAAADEGGGPSEGLSKLTVFAAKSEGSGGESGHGDGDDNDNSGVARESSNGSLSRPRSPSSPHESRADPFALVIPGCNVQLIAMLSDKDSSHPQGRNPGGGSGESPAVCIPGFPEISAVVAALPPPSPSLWGGADSPPPKGGTEGPNAAADPQHHQQQQQQKRLKEAVVITRGTMTSVEGVGESYQRILADIPPQLQLRRLQQQSASRPLQRPALRLLPEVTAAVKAAQALLDEGTYLPLQQRFLVTRLVAAVVRGMAPDAARSLLAPFTTGPCCCCGGGASASLDGTRGAADRRGDQALEGGENDDPHRQPRTAQGDRGGLGAAGGGGAIGGRTRSKSEADAAGSLLRAATMSPVMATSPAGFPMTPIGTGPLHSHDVGGDRPGALTPSPRLNGETEGAGTAAGGGGGGARLLPGSIGLRRPTSPAHQPKQPSLTTAATTSAAHVEGPALVHHHRYRYPVVESVGDVGQLYMNALHEAEGMLSPHDPLRAALVQSVVDFHATQLQDPRKALAILEDYLDDVEEEQVQLPLLQAAPVLGDTRSAATTASTAAAAAAPGATPPHATTSTFSVTSVRHSQQKQLPASGVTAALVAKPVPAASADVTSGVLPLVPMVIPSWGTRDEEAQFVRVLGMLRSTQEALQARCQR